MKFFWKVQILAPKIPGLVLKFQLGTLESQDRHEKTHTLLLKHRGVRDGRTRGSEFRAGGHTIPFRKHIPQILITLGLF